MKVLVELRFCGGAYHGWQAQDNAPTVQRTVTEAAERLLGSACAVTGCSRTDAGVHAKQFFCTFDSAALDAFPLDRLPTALNTLLPDDVSAVSARRVDDGFHARYGACAKEYIYRIYCGKTRDALEAGRVWMLPGRTPDEKKMDEAAGRLAGRHDFSSFCAAGGKVEDKTRCVYYCRVEKEGDVLTLRICADGFLYNMVRIIAGTLYEIGAGRPLDVDAILAARSRAAAGMTAPPEGLYLNRVFYTPREVEEAAARV